jgi:uncharacterized caspase-like protein
MPTPGEHEERHALVVAVARYGDPKLQQLRSPAADAERLAAVLRDPAKGNFSVDVLIDENHASLTRRIASFFRDRGPHDLLLLHFSCHGVKDERGELYLAATDTELDLLSATGVSAAWLNDQISRTRSRRTVVLLDCCFSGSFPFGMSAKGGDAVDAPQQLEGRGRAVITASSGMEYAYEGGLLRGEGQPSVFTDAIVEGLETGKADLDHDQLISVDDLYGFVYDRVKEHTPNQTPNKKSEIAGPLYLARSSYRPAVQPARLDPELLARTEDRYAGIRAGAVQELAELAASHDPATVLAAREALSRMTGDDSRRVSETAQAALLTAERAVAERAERDRAEAQREQDGREPPATPSSSPRRRRPAILAAVVLAGVAAVAIVATQLGGGDPSRPSGSTHPTPTVSQTLLGLVPASIRGSCRRDPANQWMVGPNDAREQAVCLRAGYSVDYGLWPSARKARAWVGGARDSGASSCETSTENAMARILPHAATGCEDFERSNEEAHRSIQIWWNEDDSPVGGWFVWLDRDQIAALEQWKKLVQAG